MDGEPIGLKILKFLVTNKHFARTMPGVGLFDPVLLEVRKHLAQQFVMRGDDLVLGAQQHVLQLNVVIHLLLVNKLVSRLFQVLQQLVRLLPSVHHISHSKATVVMRLVCESIILLLFLLIGKQL